ncbi:MAG: DUF4296 domain-containing protein [Chitinophagaceae bacterium]|nr:MAG: DUF4296 domain-containing protein [Chitinophagaceae bacterium]
MMKFTSLILVLLLFIACRDKTKVPSDILAKDKMEKVLWDMMLADRFAAQFILRDSTKKDVQEETFRAYSQVFSMHNISRQEFVKSYKFYMTRPDLSKVIMDTILQRSNRLKEENYKPRMATPPDSLPKPTDTIRRDSIK